MEFSEIRARWEQLCIYATHSEDRAPLVLDEQERAVIPSEYDPKRGKLLTEMQPVDGELLESTRAFLAAFLEEQVRPDGSDVWKNVGKLVPDEVRDRHGVLVDIDWPMAWFAYQLLIDAGLRDAYLGPLGTRREHYSTAERVEFLRCLSCLIAYALKAIVEETTEPVPPPAPISELEFANALLYLVAEYAHVVLELPRRLAIEKHLQALLGSETGLYLTQDLYRDHTFHMVYVCLLGDFLLQCETATGPLAEYLYRWCRSSVTLDRVAILKSMRRTWYLTALFHDLGYPLVLLRTVDKLTEYLDCKMVKRLRDAVGGARMQATKEFVGEAGTLLGLDGLTEDDLDHGVVSAVMLRHLLEKIAGSSAELEEYQPALRAIARHNLKNVKVAIGQPSLVPASQQDNDAMSLLLLLCDEVQEWGRVRVDPKRYRQEVAAKMQFAGENPLESQRILRFLALSARWDKDRFRFINNEITLDLIYRPLHRSEESYLGIWLDRTRNLQRVALPDALGTKFMSIEINSFWKDEAREGREELDDLEILANYVRNHHRWELDPWLAEAWDETKKRVTYRAPRSGMFGYFNIHLNELAGTDLLPESPNFAEIFHWLRTYPARLSFRTSS